MDTIDSQSRTIIQALSEPFDLKEIKFKPQVVQGNRALAACYVDARVVQDRLDDVVGVEGWQDEYEVLPDNSVVCRLRLKIGGEWVTKMDVGGPSEQPDGGDRMKAAFSDALKRAAVKFGVGRYLYRVPQNWCDYDPAKRQFKAQPMLPAFALPRKPAPVQGKPPVALPAAETKPEPPAGVKPSSPRLPDNPADFVKRVREFEDGLIEDGICKKWELFNFLSRAGVMAGYPGKLEEWTAQDQYKFASRETKRFIADREAEQAVDKADSAAAPKTDPPRPAKPETLQRLKNFIGDGKKVCSWKAAFQMVGVWPGQGWEEPENDDEILAVSEFVLESQAQDLLTKLMALKRPAVNRS